MEATLPQTEVLQLQKAGGWHVLTIRGERDIPGYDPAEVGKGLSDQAFRREVLGDWTATAGKLVYPEFGPVHEAVQAIPYDPTRQLVLGWDLPGGNGGTPACVVTQLSARGQWLILSDVMPGPDETVGIYEFGERVAEHLHERYCRPHGIELSKLRLMQHFGDPAGQVRPPATVGSATKGQEMRSAFEVLLLGEKVFIGTDYRGREIWEEKPGRGWVVEPGEVSLTKRMEAVRARLTHILSGGLAALVVSPEAQQVLDAFRGGYHYHQRADGRYELDPMKNESSHVADALSYSASRLFAEPARKEEEAWSSVGKMAVRAPGRRRERW